VRAGPGISRTSSDDGPRARAARRGAAGRLKPVPKQAQTDAAPFAAERRRLVRRWLVERGSVRVADLARQLGVSDETVRRDLRGLAAEGVAETVHGGAIVLSASGAAALGVPPLERRQTVEQDAKRAIGAAAARRVESGQVVILDTGSTTVAVADHLRQHDNLTIVTNSLTVAQVAAGIPTTTTYVVGGKLVTGSLSLIGPQAHRDLAKISADWAFLGSAAIHAGGGFTSADPYEAEIKRAMIRAARQVAIVADHTKFDARRFASFAEATDIQYLFTTSGVPDDARAWLERAGVTVVICDAAAPTAGDSR
jgi:DeoR/GlpR family transcriptional regulator of sugar metabolism